MTTDTMVIELDDGTTQPMTPNPNELSDPFAEFISAVLTIPADERARFEAAYDAWLDRDDNADAFDQASDRVHYAIQDAGLGWSCQFGEPDATPEAGPYIETLRNNGLRGTSWVAAAVLTRELKLITEADWTTLVAWWLAAGNPLPAPGYTALRLAGVDDDAVEFAADADEVARNAKELNRDQYLVPGWPVTAVSALGVAAADGRYDGWPGLVWYSNTSRKTGAELIAGDYLDTFDHRGARMIWGFKPDVDGARVAVIGATEENPLDGEDIMIVPDTVYPVVDVNTYVDLDNEVPYLLQGGPLDGQVRVRPKGTRIKNYAVSADVNGWQMADQIPADAERYIRSVDDDGDAVRKGAAIVLTWRTATADEIDRDRAFRAKYGDGQ